MDTIMHVNPVAVRLKSRAWLFLPVACLLACHKKSEAPPPEPDSKPAVDSLSGTGSAPAPAAEPDSAPVPAASSARLEFTTRPPAKAYRGRPYLYR
ncbi:MAG TPA: hypothetical protein VJ385_19340, partial [Fibrobacteria bacterium]|nr:hypothetical protein [Fibrobacteria bacterium]